MNNEIRPAYTKKRIIVPSVTAILFLLIGIYMGVYGIYFQSTDDAFVEGRMISVSPKVEGHVIKLLIDDNTEVKKGDLLLEIDPVDFETALKEKEAALEAAKANLNAADKQVEHSKFEVKKSNEDVLSASSKFDFAQKDFKRYEEMYKEGIVSKQDFDRAKTALTVADANLKAANQSKNSTNSLLHTTEAGQKARIAEIKRLEAEVEQARLNLSYTKIYSPSDGLVVNRSVEEGNYVQIAQNLFGIVPDEVWVIANFKETQLTDMKKGQDVEIKIDTYPNKKFRGKVDSIQRASGAKASLFPPENAVGSYVKVVQRIPVKIVFTEDIGDFNVVPGMSVVPKVKVK